MVFVGTVVVVMYKYAESETKNIAHIVFRLLNTKSCAQRISYHKTHFSENGGEEKERDRARLGINFNTLGVDNMHSFEYDLT